MMRRKVLIVKFSYERLGGIDKQILRIVKYLTIESYEFGLITNNIKLPLGQSFKELGGRVYQVDFSKKGIVSASKTIAKIAKEDGWEVLQAHLFRESMLCRGALLYNRKIKHIFRAQTYIDCAWIPSWKKRMYHIMDKLTSKFVDKYLANGPEVEKEIIYRSHINRKKVLDIINGTEQIKKNNIFPLKIDNDNLRVAMIANLLEKKGHDVLIKAIGSLKKDGVIVKVRLIGDEISGGYNDSYGKFKKKLIGLAKEHDVIGQIEFYGYTTDLVKALDGFSFVVLPSDSEGVPNCILEAMSLKRIVIASNVGAVYKMIDHGKSGFMHEPLDYIGFAQVLIKIKKMEKEELLKIAENGYRKWQKEFSIENMILGLNDVYSNLD